MRLMPASLLVLPSSTSPILLMDCLKVGTLVLVLAEIAVVVAISCLGYSVLDAGLSCTKGVRYIYMIGILDRRY